MQFTILDFNGCQVQLADEQGRFLELHICEICDFEEGDEVLINIAGYEVLARIDAFDDEHVILEYRLPSGEGKLISRTMQEVAGLRIGGKINVNILEQFAA